MIRTTLMHSSSRRIHKSQKSQSLPQDMPRTEGAPDAGTPRADGGVYRPKAWNKLNFETTKPVGEKKLLEGVYDAGVAYSRAALEHPDKLEICRKSVRW
ncbi:hypothetical protein [Bradyrhizobium sp. CCBAU 45394]|uniref:hypothetical protein n=1 Tax=Bradyrhizobium sp. CCBAU 45394 TaxID=1325087 RepID=UPI0023044912|nr:hypothetical protein [Bradyrhizobium sp. CCBAU 45394]